MATNGTLARPAPRLGLAVTPTGEQVLTNKRRIFQYRYDTVRIPAGAPIPATIDFFDIPVGLVGSGWAVPKTEVQTNNERVNALEKGNAINVWGIEISIYMIGDARLGDANTQRLAAFWEDSVFEFKILDDLKQDGRLTEFSSGSGQTGIPNMSAAAPRTTLTVGIPTIRGVRRLGRTTLLQARRNFTLRIRRNPNNIFLQENVPAGGEWAIRAAFFGLKATPIE